VCTEMSSSLPRCCDMIQGSASEGGGSPGRTKGGGVCLSLGGWELSGLSWKGKRREFGS